MTRFTWRRALLVGVAAAAVAAGLMTAGDLLSYRSRVHHGVQVWGLPAAGLDVGGLTLRLREKAESVLTAPLLLTAEDAATAVVPRDCGVSVDVEATCRLAFAQGRTGSGLTSLRDRFLLWWSPQEVQPVLTVEIVAFSAASDEVALAFERLARDARLTLAGGEPGVIASQNGRGLDREALRVALIEAVRDGTLEIPAPLRAIEPALTTQQAEVAVMPARVVLASSVILGFQEKTFELDPGDLLKMASLDQAGLAVGRPFTFKTDEAVSLLQPLLKGIETPPVDAVIKPAADGKSFTVTPSKDGVTVEWDQLLAAITRVTMEPDHRYVPIPTAVAAPKLSTMDAAQLGERRMVASFETYFNPSNEARGHNIKQVAALLDGHIVRPGEVFSFNKAVGPTTRAAGFDEAPVIVDGVLTPGVGGGICQVSTTLFNAVFFAGLPVVERRPHSFYIEHYPVGRDATVSQGEVDFKFRNDTGQLVLISCSATDRSVKVSLAAAEWDRQVSYQLLPPHDFVAPASSAARPRRWRDPALAPGEVSELEPGIEGRTVRIERVVRGIDGSILFSDAFDSVYAPKDWVVRVGPPA